MENHYQVIEKPSNKKLRMEQLHNNFNKFVKRKVTQNHKVLVKTQENKA